MDHPIIQNLNWRYATKRYDTEKKITKESIDLIKEAIRLAPSSYGLQPIKILIIESKEIRKQLFECSFNQHSIVDASHLIVICSYDDIDYQKIDAYMSNTAQTRDLPLEQLNGYSNFLKQIMSGKNEEQKAIWAQKQAYIALGVLIDTCAHLKIDATPIEGFENSKYDAILDLKSKGLSSTLVIPIGYRHPEDHTQFWKKVRKTEPELFEHY
jgi:nitroreductase/dihydropteridine reductase